MFAQQTTPRGYITRFIGLVLPLFAASCSGEATSAGSSVATTSPPADGTPSVNNGTPGGGSNGTGSPGTSSGTPVGSDNMDLGLAPGESPAVAIGEECIQQDVMINTVTPTVELLVDRSGSMDLDFGAQNRWDTIRDVLINTNTGFVKEMESKVRFGLTLYTAYLAGNDDPTGAATCPNLIEQPIMLNNYASIQTTFMANNSGGSTPSAESIAAATAKLEAHPEMGPKVLVFATDGDPDTCADPLANDEGGTRALMAQTGSEMAVQAAWDKGITTYVINVGADTSETHLQNLARIGQGGDPAAAYFPALDRQSLMDAFNTILRGVISCDFNLNGTVLEQNAASGKVLIDGLEVPYGDPNGWILVGPSTVRLQGTACDTLKIQVTNVDIEFPCGTVTIF